MYFSLPQEYRQATQDDLINRITAARKQLGTSLTILAHHYQRLEVTQYADHVGDSYGLSKIAAEKKDVESIVFCGVHFMAESADILTDPQKMVYLPNLFHSAPAGDSPAMPAVWLPRTQHRSIDAERI